MQAKPTTSAQADLDHEQRSQQTARVAEQVIRDLGRSERLQRVDIRPLWSGCYRANVYLGPDAISLRLAHSYFLKVDAAGNVVAAIPPITKQYCT